MEEAIERVNKWISMNNPTRILNLCSLDLDELPPIPSTCQKLYCHNNRLKSLPELPNCTELYCSHNKLTTLPQLPSVQLIYCYNNKLTSIPTLPNCRTLYCFNNKLTSIQDQPSCSYLNCHNNKLTTIPALPIYGRILCTGNKYLYITKQQAQKFSLKETPNYNKFAITIQKHYRRHLMKKYFELINQYLFKGPTGIVCLFI